MNSAPDLLAPLERRVDQLLEAYARAQAEARLLRSRVQELEGEKAALSGRIDLAVARLQALHDGLPEVAR